MAKRAAREDAARKLAVAAATIARDKNAEEIVVLDLRGQSPVTDYFVICTGSSGPQMRTVAGDIVAHARATGHKPYHIHGAEGSGGWILLDFVDVVVHIFDPAHRRYYDLELIWGESPKVRWRRSRDVARPRPAGTVQQ